MRGESHAEEVNSCSKERMFSKLSPSVSLIMRRMAVSVAGTDE